ncbi:MAG: HAD family phosphatase, partial [bacterium]|nr:HAD family phosphatase [bacterium]
VGCSIQGTFRKAEQLGGAVPYDEFISAYNEAALKVIARAKITPGTDALTDRLIKHGFKLGLVSSSPRLWIDAVLARLPFAGKFHHVESLFEHTELHPKPSPDGYLDALRFLEADPTQALVLEDSNPGITAGKAAGAYVIGFRGCLLPGYEQKGADAYADTMEDVAKLSEEFTLR